MNRKQLYESMGEIDETVLERSEQNKRAAPKRRLPRWAGLLAAVMAVVVVGVAVLMPGSGLLANVAYAIETAQYPETPLYPNETAADFEAQYDAWWSAQRARRDAAENYDPEDLSGFFRASIPQFLSDAEGQNKAYSPLNVYFALGMLAELTGGESRQQILDLVGANSVEELRSQGVRIRILGELSALPERPRRLVERAVELTEPNRRLTLSLALNYGGRAELARAARLLAQEAVEGKLRAEDIDEDLPFYYIYSATDEKCRELASAIHGERAGKLLRSAENICPVIGAHIGPAAAGICFVRKKEG